jgi:hypothetical protein
MQLAMHQQKNKKILVYVWKGELKRKRNLAKHAHMQQWATNVMLSTRIKNRKLGTSSVGHVHSKAQFTGNPGLHTIVACNNCRKNSGARVAMYDACENSVEVQDLYVAV